MIPFEMALGTALRHWKAILGGLVLLALVTALLLTRATLADVKTDLAVERAAHAETIATYRLAQEAATVKAERQRRELEEEYRRNADEAENEYAAGLADAGERADAYIDAHRLRAGQCAGSPSSGPATATSDQRASVPPSVSAPTIMVTAEDVRACTGAVVYADEAREWAMTLNAPR